MRRRVLGGRAGNQIAEKSAEDDWPRAALLTRAPLGMSQVLLTGEEHEPHCPRLNLAYHRHYYGLGEHYNAVAPREG